MPTLIANLSTGKGTWKEVTQLIAKGEWTKILLITNEFGKKNFTPTNNTHIFTINQNLSLEELTQEITKHLKPHLTDFEVALNFMSGTGKEHMAILQAILNLGCNFRLITIKENNIITL